MLAGKTETLAIPNEQGHTMTLRSLGYRKLRDAQTEQLRNVTKSLGDIDLSQFREEIEKATERATEQKAAVAEAATQLQAAVQAEPPSDTSYDVDIVLNAGIVGWSYDTPVSKEAIGDLDPDTAEWAFTEILARSRRTVAERKDSSTSSPEGSEALVNSPQS